MTNRIARKINPTRAADIASGRGKKLTTTTLIQIRITQPNKPYTKSSIILSEEKGRSSTPESKNIHRMATPFGQLKKDPTTLSDNGLQFKKEGNKEMKDIGRGENTQKMTRHWRLVAMENQGGRATALRIEIKQGIDE